MGNRAFILLILYKGSNGWNTHTIIQYNSDEGASAVRRKPLNFSDEGSAWPIGKKQTQFLIGLELGYAPNTPTDASKSIGAGNDTDGFAGQVTFNLINFMPKHSVGLVVGRAGAGYLMSPDFRENTNLLELRYKWTIDKKQKIEARIRRREDIDQITYSLQARVDTDFYLRYTRKF